MGHVRVRSWEREALVKETKGRIINDAIQLTDAELAAFTKEVERLSSDCFAVGFAEAAAVVEGAGALRSTSRIYETANSMVRQPWVLKLGDGAASIPALCVSSGTNWVNSQRYSEAATKREKLKRDGKFKEFGALGGNGRGNKGPRRK